MILGIDPGLANTGWAILDRRLSIVDDSEFELVECGCLKTKISEVSAKRLDQIYCELEGLIKKYKVEEVAIESLFFAKNARSAMVVAEAIGAIKVAAKNLKKPIFEYTPLQIKMALAGYGRAEKEQVEVMVGNYLNLSESIKPSHASDAIAVALTHGFTMKIRGGV